MLLFIAVQDCHPPIAQRLQAISLQRDSNSHLLFLGARLSDQATETKQSPNVCMLSFYLNYRSSITFKLYLNTLSVINIRQVSLTSYCYRLLIYLCRCSQIVILRSLVYNMNKKYHLRADNASSKKSNLCFYLKKKMKENEKRQKYFPLKYVYLHVFIPSVVSYQT